MIDYEGLNKHRKETKEEILNMLKENNKIAVVRPTGYGKSHLIAELCSELPGKKLILEPGKEVINYMEKFNIETINTNYITYHSLIKANIIELIRDFEQYNYIFLDEMHRALAEVWGNKLFNIFKALNDLNNNVKILGFSATNIRGDNRDVVKEIFHGIQIQPYYLADAILDNFLPIPDYHCGIYEIEDEDKNKMILKDEQLAKQILDYDIDTSLSKMFKENLDFNKEHKIICFVDRIKNISKAANNIMKWFGTNINMFEVSCRQSKNTTQRIIDEFVSTKGINVLFCVNILNEGVHLPNVDCVIFLRKTKSNVIYNQQLGRVINTEIDKPIIFDLVNNADNPEWGYLTMFEEETEKQNKEITKLETKNGDKLKITLEQIDLIEKLRKINANTNILIKENKEFILNNKDKYTAKEFAEIFNCNIDTIYSFYKRYNITNYKKERLKSQLTKENEKFILNNKDKYIVKELAEMLNCNIRTIYNTYRKYNITDYKRKRLKSQLTKENKEFILNNKNRYTAKEFAEMFNYDVKIIYHFYWEYNITDYKREKILTEENEKFILDNKDKYTVKEFAEMFNCGIHIIYWVYSKYNITNYKRAKTWKNLSLNKLIIN